MSLQPLSATTTSLSASYCSLSSNTHLSVLIPSTLIITKYITGKTLSSDAFSILKDAIHTKTGKRFACKIINKRFEHMVPHFILSPYIHLLPLSIRPAMRSRFSSVFQVVIATSLLFTISSRCVDPQITDPQVFQISFETLDIPQCLSLFRPLHGWRAL